MLVQRQSRNRGFVCAPGTSSANVCRSQHKRFLRLMPMMTLHTLSQEAPHRQQLPPSPMLRLEPEESHLACKQQSTLVNAHWPATSSGIGVDTCRRQKHRPGVRCCLLALEASNLALAWTASLAFSSTHILRFEFSLFHFCLFFCRPCLLCSQPHPIHFPLLAHCPSLFQTRIPRSKPTPSASRYTDSKLLRSK
ncbi:hypothetical protein GQ54DRAFT_10111 [Martensiomyces pterosporus]|nr:hypothetical protein GQ54DRAFT_10111 [Martensiomyces pterosporus]